MVTIDNGAPQHNPNTHRAVRTWIMGHVAHRDDETGIEFQEESRTAVYDLVQIDISSDHVRAECQRRMILLVGARDARDLEVKISNASREAIRFLRKGVDNWTPDESARAAQLEAFDAAIERLRACSNAMEADPPADYTDDARWV